MNQHNLPYDNNLVETSKKRRTVKNITQDLESKTMKRWDIFCYWPHEYRYLWHGEFQRFPIKKVMWFHIDYLTWPFFKLTDWKFNNTEGKNTKKKGKTNKPKKRTELSHKDIAQNISDAKQYLIDNDWKLNLAEEKWVKETIQKMENFQNEKFPDYYDPRSLPVVIDTTKNTLPAIIENQWAEEIPKGTFLAENQWAEELPSYPHAENPQWEEDSINNENLEKLVLSDIPESIELHGVNVSEISNHLEEIAIRRAQERLNAEYNATSIYRKPFFIFTRKKKLDAYIEEELETFQDGWTFAPQSRKVREYASDRNESENQLFNNINPNNSILIPEINVLASQFIRWEIDQIAFETSFNKIISEHEAFSEIQDTWSNILLELIPKKAVFDSIASGERNEIEQILQHPTQRDFLQRILGLESIDENNREIIITSLISWEASEQLKYQIFEISLDVFTDINNAAFEIQNNRKIDTAMYNTGKTLQKHAIISAIGYGTTIVTASILTAWTWAISAAWVTALWALGLWGKTWARRYAEYTDAHNQAEKRIVAGEKADLSGKNHGRIRKMLWRFQKSDRQLYWTTRDISEHNQRPTREQIEQNDSTQEPDKNWKQNVQEKSRWDTLKQTVWTMHHHFMPIERLNARLEKFLMGQSLRDDENTDKNWIAIDTYLAQGLARLDMHRVTGHNFFRTTKKSETIASTDRKWHMEQSMSKLQKNIILVSQARWIPLWEIVINVPDYDFEDSNNAKTLRNSRVYISVVSKLNADLEFANSRFESIRKSTSLKTAAVTWGIYALTSSLLWLLTQGTETIQWQITTYTTPSWTTTTPGGLDIDANIATQLEASLGTTRYQTFISNIQSSTGPETLWETLTQDIFNNKNLWNDAKNQIMTFILSATDVQAGITKPELLIEAGNQGIFTDIANSSSRIDIVIDKLSEWGYGNVNKTWLIDTITGVNNGSITISNLNPTEQTKLSEALWCYVHRNAAGWAKPMLEVFMDKLPDITTIHPGEEITIPGEKTTISTSGIWWIWFPSWRNTFLPGKEITETYVDENKESLTNDNDTDRQKEEIAV